MNRYSWLRAYQFLDEMFMNEKYMVSNTEDEMFVCFNQIFGKWRPVMKSQA